MKFCKILLPAKRVIFPSSFQTFRTAPSVLHQSWSEVMAFRGIYVWETDADSVRGGLTLPPGRPGSLLQLFPLPSPSPLPFSRQTALGSGLVSPGHCHLLSLYSLPEATWTGLVGLLPILLPIPPHLWFRWCLLLCLDRSINWAWAHREKHGTSAPFGAPSGGHPSHPALAVVLASTPFSARHVGTPVHCKILAVCVPMLYRIDLRTSFHYDLSTLRKTSLRLFVCSVAIVPSSCVWVHSFFLLFFSRGWSLWTAETWWLAINSL